MYIYCVELEVWSKLAIYASVSCLLCQNAHAIWLRLAVCVNAFSHRVTLIRILLSHDNIFSSEAEYMIYSVSWICKFLLLFLCFLIISYSDTKVPVLVVVECKRANVIYVYELILLLHTSRSTECMHDVTLSNGSESDVRNIDF